MTKRSKRSNQNHVRVKSAFTSVSSLNTANVYNSLGAITTSPTGILANDVNLSYLSDMFRLFRVNNIRFEFQPSTGAGTAAVVIPTGFLGAMPYGITTTPTSMADFETPNVSNIALPFNSGGTAPITHDQRATLSLPNSSLPVLQGPGGGWLSTQNDGTQGDYGYLWWVTAAATAANTINYVLRTYFDVSFADLLDPALIGQLMQRHPNGLPSHFQLAPGTPLHAVNQSCLQKIKRSPLLITAAAPPVKEESEDDAFVFLSRKELAMLRDPKSATTPTSGNVGLPPK